MSARSRSLWTLLVATLGATALGLYAWLGVMKGDERDAEAKRNAEKLVQPTTQPDGGTTPVRYDHLSVKARGETTELQRMPDQSWVLVRPLRAAGDVRTAEDLVNALQFARLRSTVEEKPTAEDLKRYGLDSPQVEVTATAEGVPPLTVKVGLDNTFDSSAYLQRGADPKVYSVDGSTRASLDRSTFDLRDKEVLTVRDLGLTRVELTSKAHRFALARDPGQPFAFVRPAPEAADGSAVSGWIAALKADRATRFLGDTPAERQRTGVETPDVEVLFQRGATETVRVRLAAGKKETDPVYVLREDGFGTSLSEVPRTALAALDRSPAELRDRSLLHLDPQAVTRIRFQPADGGQAVVVERDRPGDGGAETWRLTAPVQGPADTFKLGSLLYTLTSLRAEATEEKLPTDPAKTGLGSAARAVVLEGADGKVLGSLTLGKASSKPAGTLARDDRGRVVVVETGRLKELPLRASDLQPPAPPPSPDGGTAG
jgi:Domain of unknown function (DUF4340)